MSDHHQAQSQPQNDNQFFPYQTKTQEQHSPYDQVLGKIILEKVHDTQKNQSKNNILSEEIQYKLNQILDSIENADHKNFQEMITLRMKQLAYSKILVFTYEKSYFRLVLAEYHIGKQYLKFDCYEQAIEHLETACTKNTKASESSNNKLYHSFILTFLAQSYFQLGHVQQALSQITKAINIQKEEEQFLNKSVDNISTLKIFALIKHSMEGKGNVYMNQAIGKVKKVRGKEICKEVGLMIYQKAKMLEDQIFDAEGVQDNKIYEQAEDNYKKSLQIIKMANYPENETQLIPIYCSLAALLQNFNQIQLFLRCLNEKYQLYQDTYGNADKKSIKQQRNLGTAYLKYKKIDESLDIFDQILEKDIRVYGENSGEVGKEYKTIGNIEIVKGRYDRAENFYRKSLKIFQDLGDVRQAREVRTKLGNIGLGNQFKS